MKINRFVTFFLIIILLNTTCSSKKETRRWYKGNLHTHSYWSDGDEFPEMIMDWYKSHGYHFVALSDHNILAEGEKWKNISTSIIREKGFKKYLEKYGEDWVVYKEDSSGISVKLKTFEEYVPLFEEAEKFHILQGEEITTSFGKKPIHINASNIQHLIIPKDGANVTEVMQNNIDAVLEQREKTGVPILPHINHPNFHYGISAQDIIGLKGERFFEVYNGHPHVRNLGDSAHISTEEMWDVINLAYFKNNQPLIYGIATDDSHSYHQFGTEYSNAGRGWVMVAAKALQADSLINAMERGEFYASTGVVLKDVDYSHHQLTIEVAPEPGIEYEIQFIGANNQENQANILKKESGNIAEFTITEEHQFVRAKVISTKLKENPNVEGEYEVAWTQPVRYIN
ncbi:histidinol-phosphatase [Fulvivirgaceae bacterium BMA12]|uniref:Histidinol-phosphatase n=1 Tax=Agaribacillus aureus TaxID=3051825 RepID=A0ABT8L4K7_9BACT|nr:histidinol-phosphatase [Fulvivirgaceae bacterium BMA12]